MAVRLWRFLMANAVWGEDMMVPGQRYACHAQAVALTYLEAFALSRDRLQAAGERNPAPYERVQRSMRRIVISRAVLCYLHEASGQNKKARSFVSREMASGFTFAAHHEAVDKKVSRLLDEVRADRHAEARSVTSPSSPPQPSWSPAHLRHPGMASSAHSEEDGYESVLARNGAITKGPAARGAEPLSTASDAALLRQLASGQEELMRGQRALQAQLASLAGAVAHVRQEQEASAPHPSSSKTRSPSGPPSWMPASLFA